MTKLIRWVQLRPLVSVLLFFTLGLGITYFGLTDAQAGVCRLGSPGIFIFLGAFALVWSVMLVSDRKKLGLITATLVASMAVGSIQAAEPPEEEVIFQPANGGIAIGVVVVCVGGYCVYRMIRFCKKKFPKKDPATNAPPSSVSFALSNGSGESAGSVCWKTSGSCFTAAAVPPAQNVLTLLAYVDVGPLPTLVPLSHDPEKEMGTQEEFNVGLAPHGVQWTGVAGDRQFALNGVPVEEHEVPFIIGSTFETGVTLSPADPGLYRVVVETSNQPTGGAWHELLHMCMPVNTPIILEDTPYGDQNFYRLRLE